MKKFLIFLISIILILAVGVSVYFIIVNFNISQSINNNLDNQEKTTSKKEESNISQKVEKNSSNQNIEANIEVTAKDIINEPLKYYGRSVLNYIEPYDIPLNYQVFHSDGENIYLISDYYIPTDYVPLSQKGNKVVDGMSLALSVAGEDYNDIDTLTDNPAQKWLSKYNDSGYQCLPERTYENSFLLDTKSWSPLKADTADYVIGCPTVELFVESYNTTHPDKKIDLKLDEKGYLFKWSTDSEDKYSNSIKGLDKREFNNLYVIHNPDDRASSVLVSYEGENANETKATFAIEFTGTLGWSLYNCMTGLRPIVCLNTNTVLVTNDKGELVIK